MDETVDYLEDEDDAVARTLTHAPRAARARGGDRDMTALHFRFGRGGRRELARHLTTRRQAKPPKPMVGGEREGRIKRWRITMAAWMRV